MKALMYHYVRPGSDLPYFRYLHLDDFLRQLDVVQEQFGVVSRNEFEDAVQSGRSRDGVVLTFDDGFSDHYEYVLPVLEERGLWGIFYIPTGVYVSGKILDVHRVHLLLGRYSGTSCLKFLGEVADKSMFPDEAKDAFRTRTYSRQSNDEATLLFKRMLNFYVSYEHRTELLDRLMERFLDGDPEEKLVERVYMRPHHLKRMAESGNVIGSHSVKHRVMSKLTVDEQRSEIDHSFQYLEEIIGSPVETFCYPHGGFHTFTAETENLLEDAGARYSFNVEPRDVETSDLLDRPQALPRYDCNLFPYGVASTGPKTADATFR